MAGAYENGNPPFVITKCIKYLDHLKKNMFVSRRTLLFGVSLETDENERCGFDIEF